MGAGGVPQAGVPPVRAEVVHRSERTRVTRLFLPGGTVICKEPLGPDPQRRTRREVVMLERLRGVAGVAQLADAPQHPGSVLLADVGEVSLPEAAKPLSAGELAGVAAGLARAVAGMHAPGVLHRDIAPAHVVLSGGGVPCLVDFALALPVADIRPGFVPYAEIAGRWRTWRRSRPGGPPGRWISGPTCARWAQCCMSWRPGRRRSVPGIRCG